MITPITRLKRLGARLRKFCRLAKSPRRVTFVPRLEGLEERVVPSLDLVLTASSSSQPFNGVVSLSVTFNDIGVEYGSGAFIDATHILTAAHVVYDPTSLDNGHFADKIKVMVGRNGSETSYDGQVYSGKYMTIDPLYGNGVFGNHDLAVITLDPNGGYPAHYNFGVSNNADQLDYRNLQLYSVGYPADNYYDPSLQPGRMYQTTGYAGGIDTSKDWFNHTPLLSWHGYPYDSAVGDLSVYIRGQSGSPIFAQDAQGQYTIVAIDVGGDSRVGTDGQKHGIPNGEEWGTAMTASESSFVLAAMNSAPGSPSQHRVSLGGQGPLTTTSLDTSTANVTNGWAVTFTAHVTGPGSVNPSGTVTFYDGGTVLGTATLSSSAGTTSASLTTSALAQGSHTISAVYGGDGTFQGSTSAGVTETIYPGSQLVSITLNSSATSIQAGQSVTFTETVNGSPRPTGTVTFYDGGTVLGTADLFIAYSGWPTASFTTSALSVGTHNNIWTLYSGDNTYWRHPSGSLTVNVTVPPPPAHLAGVASALTHSTESYGDFITAAYQRYLGRIPAAAEVSSWVGAMANGLRDETVEAGFIGSPEYIAAHGGQGAGWVQGMYRDLLGRTPAQSEVDGWVAALNAGSSPQQVAYGFAASAEREGMRVRHDYLFYLGRNATRVEVDGWVGAFEQGTSNEDVIAGFVGSAEYFDNNGSDALSWLRTAYQDVLGRPADQAASNSWLPLLQR